jgi:hypothetical protein
MNSSDIIYGKVPPQAMDIEEMIIGAMLIERDACISALNLLREEMFNKEIEVIKDKILLYSGISEKYFGDGNLDSFAKQCLQLRISSEYFVRKFIFWYFGINKENV